ncbi:MAG: hypothetical protein LBB65_00095 [Burkholderiales bacterium]|jgi:hypothetical protein|nr:hypothetical protein [Burkholderiales bacterium]
MIAKTAVLSYNMKLCKAPYLAVFGLFRTFGVGVLFSINSRRRLQHSGDDLVA